MPATEPWIPRATADRRGESARALGTAQHFTIATRYAPQGTNHAQERDKLKAAFRLSLTRLRTDRVRILYLTTRDHSVPLESTLRGIQDLHDEGLSTSSV